MAIALWSTLTDRISPSVPGCPSPVIENYVHDAAIEVCERTLAFKYVQAQQTLVDGTYSYAYVPDTETEVHAVISANVNNIRIDPATMEATAERYPWWPTTDSDYRSTPQYFVHFDTGNYYVVPTPNDDPTYLLDMVLALKPTRSATGLEQVPFDELEDVIVDAALQHLLVLPEKTWTDRELAAYHAKQFIFKVAERRARATLGAGRASLQVRAVPFA